MLCLPRRRKIKSKCPGRRLNKKKCSPSRSVCVVFSTVIFCFSHSLLFSFFYIHFLLLSWLHTAACMHYKQSHAYIYILYVSSALSSGSTQSIYYKSAVWPREVKLMRKLSVETNFFIPEYGSHWRTVRNLFLRAYSNATQMLIHSK